MELVLSLPLLFLFMVFLYSYYYFTSSKNNNNDKGFKNHFILGTLPELLKNRHRFLDWSTEILSSCPTNTSVFRRPGNIQGVITANPLNVKYVLKTNFENYPKGEWTISLLMDFLGQGIFNSDGDLWKIQRKTASYEFNTKSLRNFIIENVWLEISTRLILVLDEARKTDQVLDLQDVLERFAFDNICTLAFNVDPGCLSVNKSGSEFMAAFEDAATLSAGRFWYAVPFLWKFKKFFNLGSERKLMNSIKIIHDYAENMIIRKLETRDTNQDQDLLSRFVKKEDNSPEFLRDIVISFILAGRDTTSSALCWFFWLLSLNPTVEEKILKELKSIQQRNGKSIGDGYTMEELRQMQYLHAAISESLRLYPPVPVDQRICSNNDVLPDGTFVGKDWILTYHAYGMGRMEAIWGENCKEFLPERWIDENGNCKQESAFKFPIFHAGPRMCLGKEMAYIQMKSIVAAILERFVIEVQVPKDKCPEHVLSLTLRMKHGLSIRVRDR